MQLAVTEKPKSAHPNLKMEIVTITPGIAQAYLDKNIKNRNLSRATVAAYRRDMIAGRWQLSGEAIKFDKNGRLIDGQHRLTACVEADMPFQSLVIYGVEPDAINTIDTNRPRRIGDALLFHGAQHVTRLAAAIRVLSHIASGDEYWSGQKMTNQEALSWLHNHPLLPRSVTAVQNVVGAPSGAVAAVHYLGHEFLSAPETADAFVEVFVTGVPSYEGCPAHLMRERMLRERHSKDTRFTANARVIATIHCWNYFARREPLNILKIPKTARIEGLDRRQLAAFGPKTAKKKT